VVNPIRSCCLAGNTSLLALKALAYRRAAPSPFRAGDRPRLAQEPRRAVVRVFPGQAASGPLWPA
jgi:hypothetical protein